MEEGKKLDETKTEEALKAKGLPLKSFTQSETPVPAVTYQLKVAGTG